MPGEEKDFRVVLVENDDNDVFFIERALNRAGFEFPLTRLADGQDAIDYFSRLDESAAPDLILLDIQMPRRNGFEVLEWLRRQPAFRERRVIMLTSSDDPGDLQRARDLGADDYLTKRTHCREVIQVLERYARPGRN
jgi:CheY-like chemotaxis protein